jgi:tetratricopeptide (TPR) repeat protein
MKISTSSFLRFVSLALLGGVLTWTLPGCNGSKAFVKRAGKMEEAGLMDQAANLYYTAVVKKPTNIDAMVGLKRTGQIVLGQHIASFDEAVAYNQRETALDAWHRAEAWDSKLEAVGVDLAFPEAKRATYESVKNAFLDASYRQANILLEQEMFDEALLEFDAILELDATYQDAPALRNVAFCEPRYRRGVVAQEGERFREAHKEFADITATDSGYKDASDRLTQVLEDGRFTVALVEFKNGSSRMNLEVKIQTLVEQALMNSDDPFLRVVDRESLALILQEQSMGLSGLTSGGDVEIGNILGAKALLKATITTCDHRESRLSKSYQTGYEQYKVERVNEEGKKYTETKYRQVQYREFVQDASVDIACTFKFISTTTGEVVASNTLYGRASDNIRYIEYDGVTSKFYLGGNSGAQTGSAARAERDRLLNGRRAIRGVDALTDEAGQLLANQMQTAVEYELLTLVP